MNKKEAVTQLEIMATNATGRLCEAKAEERALLYKEIESLNMGIDALKDYKPKTGHWIGTEYDGYADGYPVYDVLYTCLKCGKCGRKFESGIMVDNGGTTVDEEEYE